MYECHVTVERWADEDERDRLTVIAGLYGWKTSAIDGDPVLGQKVFFYYTAHDLTVDKLKAKMHRLEGALQASGIEVVRSKIEHIVYDTKTGIGVE